MSTDPYAALGLDGAAPQRLSQVDIEKAYRVKAREAHPDKGGDAAAFAVVQRAYDLLGDAAARQEYDARTAEAATALESAAAEVLAYAELPRVAEAVDDGYSYPCRCGGAFDILEEDVADTKEEGAGAMVIECSLCSLSVEVQL